MTSSEPLTRHEKEILAALAGWCWEGFGDRWFTGARCFFVETIDDIFGGLPPDMLRVLIRHYTEKR